MMFQRLRRGEEFDQCPSCQRILYFREPPDAEEEASSTGASSAEGRGSETTA
jgi:hypothetical protein